MNLNEWNWAKNHGRPHLLEDRYYVTVNEKTGRVIPLESTDGARDLSFIHKSATCLSTRCCDSED